jgi:hypothetical protein
MTWIAAAEAAMVAMEAVEAAEALATAEAAANAAIAAEATIGTSAVADAGLTAANTAANTGITAANPLGYTFTEGANAANLAAEGSNAAAQQMQEQAVKRGLEQAVNPDQAMFEEMQRQIAQDRTNPFQGERLGDLADWDSGVKPVGDAVQSPLSEVVNKASSTQPSFDQGSQNVYDKLSNNYTPTPTEPTNPFMDAYNSASKYVEENKFKTGLGVYGLLSATGQLQNKGDAPPPKKTFNNPYHFSSDFQGTHPNPNDYQYTPKYPSYAMGGITSIPPRTNFADPSQSMMGTSQYSMATDPMSGNIANRMAEGGVTGGGQMQLNVPINIGEGGGGTGGFGGGGGYGGYTSGAGYAPPGGPQGGSAGSLASLLKGAQQGKETSPIGPQAQGAQAQGAQMNMQENAQSAQGMSNDGLNGFSPIQTNQGTLLAGQFLQGLSGLPDQQESSKAMGAMPFNMQAQSNNAYAEPQNIGMARGGITDVPSYKRGGDMDIYDASLRFANMLDNPSRYTPPDTRFQSVDTFRDTNPNTATKLADEAAETRRKAIEQRSYVNTGAKFPTASRRPGQLDLGPVGGERGKYDNQESILAAQGGIMGYNLGGYANGGNPRLLRGPGDGMSDNIPATIADRQPARLADGEFVIPADVVSHLGNGSTEAGAKKLHEMMNSVRQARTGNPKQGKKINPSKFMPKK